MAAGIEQLADLQQKMLKELQDLVKSNKGGTSSPVPGQLGRTAGTVLQQAASGQLGRAAEGAAKGAGGLAGGAIGGAIGGPAGAAAGKQIGEAIAGVAVEIVKLPGLVRQWADSVQGANRAFADVSGAMAGVFAKSDWQDMMRNMRKGDELAGSAGGLSSARQGLQNALEPMDVAFQKLQNEAMAKMAEIVTAALEDSNFVYTFTNIANDISAILKKIDLFGWLNRKNTNDQDKDFTTQIDKLIEAERKKIWAAKHPVGPAKPRGDPRPSFPHDPLNGAGADF